MVLLFMLIIYAYLYNTGISKMIEYRGHQLLAAVIERSNTDPEERSGGRGATIFLQHKYNNIIFDLKCLPNISIILM